MPRVLVGWFFVEVARGGGGGGLAGVPATSGSHAGDLVTLVCLLWSCGLSLVCAQISLFRRTPVLALGPSHSSVTSSYLITPAQTLFPSKATLTGAEVVVRGWRHP